MTRQRLVAPWGLRRRLWVATSVALVVTTVVAVITVGTVSSLRATQSRLTGVLSPAGQNSAIYLSAMLDQETGVRGYQLTADRAFLQPYLNGRRAADAVAVTTDDLLSQDPSLRQLFDQAVAAGTAWQVEYAIPTVARTRAGSSTQDSQLAGKVLFDRMRAEMAAVDTALTAQRSVTSAQLTRITNRLVMILISGLVLLILAFVLLILLLKLWITDPIERLALETRLVSDGNYGHIVAGTGPPDFVGLGADVDTMRRTISASLAEATDLRDVAQEQSFELERQAVELTRSNTELEQFAYVASHDLQEPLRKVASFTQLLQQRYGGQLDDRADQYIEFAVDGAKRMQLLISDLLDFSQVGRMSVAFERVDLNDAVDAARRSLAQLLEDTDAEVVVPLLPVVSGSRMLLTQLFQNLIGNAVKFRGADRPVVKIECLLDGPNWHFRIDDNGIGIDPRYGDKIFVIFQRLHPKETYAGTGIGLALCRKIVEHHGGQIWLAEPEGSGARFDWTLPVQAPTDQTTTVQLNIAVKESA